MEPSENHVMKGTFFFFLASHKRHQDVKLFKPKGQKKATLKKKEEKSNFILPHVRVHLGRITKS